MIVPLAAWHRMRCRPSLDQANLCLRLPSANPSLDNRCLRLGSRREIVAGDDAGHM